MRDRSKGLIVVLFTSVFLLSVITNLNSNDINFHYNVKNEDTSLKSSDNEISINTPENITYTEPMSGYYPGSIGFEDDIIGTIPDDWWYHIPDSGSFYRVVSEWQGHKNVYEIRKNGGTQKVSTSVNFASAASAGSVDFWLYKDTDSSIDPSRINLEDGFETDYFTFGFDEATLYIGTWQDKQQIFPNAFSKNVWHYVKVDFNLSLGWQVQIDDIIYGIGYQFNTYVGTPTQVMNFQIESIWSGCNPNYGTWVDAIGYSWDPNYNVGDNKNEGLLLGYNNNTNLSWQGYSLDGQANNTIYGNYTIPLPQNGHHSIQVFGNDTSGTYYKSDLRHFTVNNEHPTDINIITPESIVYDEPMSGYYPATYGFENDEGETNPENWIVYEPSGSSIQIENEINGHKKVVSIRDWSSGVSSYFSYDLPNQITYGTVEFWFSAAGTSANRVMDLRAGNGNIHGASGNTEGIFDIIFDTNDFIVRNGTNTNIGTYITNQWYHIKIDFECTTGGYAGLNQYHSRFYINGEDKGMFGFWNIKDYIDVISFESWGLSCQTDEKLYFDGVGFSWDINYNIGDNLNESLLLSYDSITALDWQGYSLDGQENVTIFGNTTLPALSNGIHSVQLHGNRSIINDLSTNITGSKYGDPQWVSGKIGTYAIDFDGNGDYFSLDKTLEIGTISHTVSMWVKVSSSFPDDQRVGIMLGNWVDFSSNDYCNWEIYTYGRIRFCWYGTCFLGTSDLRDDSWHLITYIRDKTANKVFVYLDAQIEFIIDSAQPDVSLGSRPTHCIGKDRRGGTQVYFNGLIDDIRIFSEVINVQHVEWLYNGGMGRNESLTVNQGAYEVNWWKLEEGSGNNIYDSFTDINTTYHYQSDLIYFVISFNNNIEPELTNGNVLPSVGDQTTEFNFTVIFWDEDNSLPLYVNVVINGTTCAMEKTFPFDNNYTDGCYYEYKTFILPSEYNYTYYFECSDGKFTNTTTAFNNLKVNKVNYNSPQLLFPEVSPDYGGLTTDFVFNVWYYDLDDNYPLDINITIDTSTFLMSQVNSGDTNATDGIEFSYTTNLNLGTHTFRFNCSDGIYSNSTNWIISPEVNPLYGINPVELLSPSTNSQVFSNLLEFSWSSLDAGFGAVNFTLQVSNVTDFSHIIYQSEDIAETPIVTNFSVPLSITHGDYYWRVKPRFGSYNGSWSSYAKFTYIANENTPLLVLDDITPTDGTRSTIFRFTVIYSDLDNNAPEYVKILINGTPYSMEMVDPLDEDFIDGCIYQYFTLLTPSTFAYIISFECSDGAFQYSTSTYQGPLVESDIPLDGEQGLDNLNSTNALIMGISIVTGLSIVIPMVVLTEIKLKKTKMKSKKPSKIKK